MRGPSRNTVSREQRRRRSEARRSRRRRLYLIGGGLVAAALIAGLFVPSLNVQPSSTEQPQTTPIPVVGTEVETQDNGVLEPGASATYATSPPTSGLSLEDGATWGALDAQAPNEAVVRNLTEGGVVFNYGAAGEEEVATLRSFVAGLDGYPGCYVVQPYDGVGDGQVTLTAWGWTHTVALDDTESMSSFVASRRNQAPLFIDGRCGAPAPTPTPAPPTPTPAADGGEIVIIPDITVIPVDPDAPADDAPAPTPTGTDGGA